MDYALSNIYFLKAQFLLTLNINLMIIYAKKIKLYYIIAIRPR